MSGSKAQSPAQNIAFAQDFASRNAARPGGARQFGAGTFKFRDSYLVLVFIYVTLTVVLSLLVSLVEKRLSQGRQEARA